MKDPNVPKDTTPMPSQTPLLAEDIYDFMTLDYKNILQSWNYIKDHSSLKQLDSLPELQDLHIEGIEPYSHTIFIKASTDFDQDLISLLLSA
ncbi:MAG: hypothetical protein WCH65_00175 [bacterium]